MRFLPLLSAVFITALSCSETPKSNDMELLTSEVDAMLGGEVMKNPFLQHFDSMPSGGIKMRHIPLGGSLPRVFNDSNYKHMEAARQLGIDPMETLADTWTQGAYLVPVISCREYYVDNLTHSLPYLVPQAHDLLMDIGRNFNDSLRVRGGGDYRIKVTSVTRTPASLARLRRRNTNASDSSAHRYGTTFDISYAKFICDSVTVPHTQENLKLLLAEVLKQMRDSGRCYVKYERRQGCFHITARP